MSVRVEWSHPENGPLLEVYTITVTEGANTIATLTTDETNVNTTLPYDQMNGIRITANNCAGMSDAVTLDYFEGIGFLRFFMQAVIYDLPI